MFRSVDEDSPALVATIHKPRVRLGYEISETWLDNVTSMIKKSSTKNVSPKSIKSRSANHGTCDSCFNWLELHPSGREDITQPSSEQTESLTLTSEEMSLSNEETKEHVVTRSCENESLISPHLTSGENDLSCEEMEDEPDDRSSESQSVIDEHHKKERHKQLSLSTVSSPLPQSSKMKR